MNGAQVRDAMTTFLGAQLARWEGRDVDANTLEEGFEGDNKDLVVGAYILNMFLVTTLAEERGEPIAHTTRHVLDRINTAQITCGMQGCKECGGL